VGNLRRHPFPPLPSLVPVSPCLGFSPSVVLASFVGFGLLSIFFLGFSGFSLGYGTYSSTRVSGSISRLLRPARSRCAGFFVCDLRGEWWWRGWPPPRLRI